MLDAKLIVVGGDAKAGEFQLRLPCQIGRSKQATLTLPHHLVSRKHCEIREKDGKLLVQDLGSMNGTYIKDQKIVGEAILEPGELLTIGTVTFRALYQVGQALENPEPQRPATVEPSSGKRQREAVPTESLDAQKESADRETVYDDERAGDTNKSLPSIDFEEVVIEAEEKKGELVGMSAIDSLSESLPESPNVSFKGFQLDGENQNVESVVDLDVQAVPQERGNELDSFLKKMPK